MYKKFFKKENNIVTGDLDLFLISEQEKGMHIDDFTIFNESAIKPDEYVYNLLNVFIENKKEFHNIKHVDEFIMKLNLLYKNDRIMFILVPRVEYDYFIVGGSTKEVKSYCTLYCTNLILDFENDFDSFIKSFKKMLQHEIIHREQMLRIGIDSIIKKVFQYSPKDRIKYLSTKQEIMSYAWQIVYEYKIAGKSNDVIKELLRKDSYIASKYSRIYQEYLQLFDKKSDVIKLLYKYMYMYLN